MFATFYIVLHKTSAQNITKILSTNAIPKQGRPVDAIIEIQLDHNHLPYISKITIVNRMYIIKTSFNNLFSIFTIYPLILSNVSRETYFSGNI